MSEDETKITATAPEPRVKDPKRVAAGKRLGAISKAAKEKKAKERYDRERELEAAEGDWNWMGPVAGIGITVVGIVGLCYVCCKREPTEPSPTAPVPCPEPCPKRTALDSFD